MITFSHSGDFGDILFSMYFCNDFVENIEGKSKKFNLILTIDENKWSKHKFQAEASPITKMTIDFLKTQPYIENVVDFRTISDFEQLRNSIIDIDLFRKCDINTSAGDIRNYYYHPWIFHGKREFWKPILFVKENDSFSDKILLTYTFRHINPKIDYNALKPYANNLVFIGFDSEKDFFAKKYFDLEHYKFDSFYDVASKMAGAAGLLGNPGGLYSIAECLKCKRVLLTPELQVNNFIKKIEPGYVNVNPLGGWCDIATTTEKMVKLVENMLNKINKP